MHGEKMDQEQSQKTNDQGKNNSSTNIENGLFKRVVEKTRDMIYRYEIIPERHYSFINSASIEITGYTPQEFYADPDLGLKITHPDDQFMLASMTKGSPFFDQALEMRWFRKDGALIWLELYNIAICDQKGDLIAIEGIVRDITKKKLSEESLRQNEERFRGLFANNYAIMLLIDPGTGKILDANQAATSFFGWGLEVLTQMNIGEINTYSKTKVRSIIQKALKGKNTHFLVDHRRADGSIRNMEAFLGPIQVSGKTLLYDILHDITDRQKEEQDLKHRLLETETNKWVSNALRRAESEEMIISILLDELIENIGVPACSIVLYDRLLGQYRPANKKNLENELKDVDLHKYEGMFDRAMETREEIFFVDTRRAKQPDIEIISELPPGWHGICFPFQSTQSILGVILVFAPKIRVFSDLTLRLLGIIGDIGANAIQRIRIHKTLEDSYLNLQNEIRVRKETEALLAKEKELLSISLLSIGEGIISTELDGTITLFNSAAEVITGFSNSEAIGHPIEIVFQIVDELTQKISPDPINYLINYDRPKTENPFYRLPVLISKNGEKKKISGKISPILLDKIKTGYIIVFDDQTENERLKTHSTLSQKMEAIGQLAAGIAHEINTPIQYIGDNVTFLNRAFIKLKENNDMLMDFFNRHQDKPANTDEISELMGVIEIKKMTHYFDEIPNAIQETFEGVDRVRKIVMAIREYSHPSEKEKRQSDINQGIQTTITISRNEWKYYADLATNLEPDLPLVYCQVDEINQVILNMIVNAAQSIHEKIGEKSSVKGKITISTKNEGEKVVIIIQDTGKGIPADIVDRIFEPFFTTKEIGQGTGQGLSIAHSIIVKKHHGMIYLDSTVGVGTTFTIELPVNYQGTESPHA
jgi:two-component system, NtrC family, sensor kinase